jgi:hypothetical protein
MTTSLGLSPPGLFFSRSRLIRGELFRQTKVSAGLKMPVSQSLTASHFRQAVPEKMNFAESAGYR